MTETEIYLYKEYDEDDSYECESIKAYLSQKDAVNNLAKQVKARYNVKDLKAFALQYNSDVDTENGTFAILSEPYKPNQNFIVEKLRILGHDGEPIDALDIYCLTEAKRELSEWKSKPDGVVIDDDLIERVAASIKDNLKRYNIDEAVAEGAGTALTGIRATGKVLPKVAL